MTFRGNPYLHETSTTPTNEVRVYGRDHREGVIAVNGRCNFDGTPIVPDVARLAAFAQHLRAIAYEKRGDPEARDQWDQHATEVEHAVAFINHYAKTTPTAPAGETKEK